MRRLLAVAAGVLLVPVLAAPASAGGATVVPVTFSESFTGPSDLSEFCLAGPGQLSEDRSLKGRIVDRGAEQHVVFAIDIAMTAVDADGVTWTGNGVEHGSFSGVIGETGDDDEPRVGAFSLNLLLRSSDGRTVRPHLSGHIVFRPDGTLQRLAFDVRCVRPGPRHR